MFKTLRGFKEFIMRGNVVDLAVGIVIGASFTALVTAFTTSFIEPLIKLFGGGTTDTREGGEFVILGESFTWAKFLNALVTFLITAGVLYFLVVTPMNKFAERRKRGQEPEPKAPSEEVILLTEIRDLLRQDGLPHQRTGQTSAPDRT
ncbi:MAG TPA: large conductance mechanosensitive channel protein MscL [Micromonosporaceae bacterium]